MNRDSSPQTFKKALGVYAMLVGLAMILANLSC